MGVRRVTQSVNNQNVQALQEGEGGGGKTAAVGEIGKIADTKTGGRMTAMHERYRDDFQSEQVEGTFDGVRFEQLVVTVGRVTGKDVRELFINLGECALRCEAGDNGFVQEVKAAEIVDAMDMIRMGMGKENGIDFRDTFPDCLVSQVS